MKYGFYGALLFVAGWSCQSNDIVKADKSKAEFSIVLSESKNELSIHQGDEIIVKQVAQKNHRPYLHPLMSPDGKSVLTEYSPGHHKHQTGIYWGFTRVNGRDFFHNPGEDYWRRVDLNVLQDTGQQLTWQTKYEMLDSMGEVLLTETQIWTFQTGGDHYYLDLEWRGEASQAITIGEYEYGGLFIRMPWKKGIPSRVENAARDIDLRAEGKRAMWLDLGMQVEGREDKAHIAIYDHPQNGAYPTPWRVDGQFGVGPARSRLGDWQIPLGHTEIIKYRLDIFTGEMTDIELTQQWEKFSGADGMYSTASLWGIAQAEGRNAKFLTPEEAVDEMSVQEGYEANVWVAEPDITQPMAFCWDHRGRLWVAENRDYESRGDGFSNSGDSRILILEDTDRDGVADSRKVFLEGIAFPAAIAVGFDGLFLGAPPHLLFVPDKNHDDRADLDDIEVRLTGWGIRDRHETLNSLHWGPDGWLYGCQGFATPSKVRKPKGDEKLYRHHDRFPVDLLSAEGVDINGGIWRYHPTKDRFEVVSHGFSNPWGIDYDEHGQLFISACVIPHLWHIIPGGIYHRQGGQHFNPYVYADIQTIADHRHRSAHGGLRVYLSDAFPEDQYGRLFMANIHEHAVLSDVLEKNGSGFSAHHGDDFLMANNAQWIGFSMEIGPDGGLYVLDWHDADICGKEVLHKETGRVFRIMPKNNHAKDWDGRYDDLSTLSDEQLVDLQTQKSAWHSRRARLILQERSVTRKISDNALTKLSDILSSDPNTPHRLNALWTMHNCGLISSDEIEVLLDDEDEYIRAWSIQLLCEDRNPDKAALKKFADMASTDRSAVVRLYLAAALQRIPTSERWPILENLLGQQEDIDDPNIPYMLWFALEPMVVENPEASIDLIVGSKFEIINQFISRRLVDGNKFDFLASNIPLDSERSAEMLNGILKAMEGRTDVTMPESWRKIYPELERRGGETAEVAGAINNLFGDQEIIRAQLAILSNKSGNGQKKVQAINQLALRHQSELLDYLPDLVGDEITSVASIRAIAQYDREDLGKMLIDKYHGFDAMEKNEAIQTLASRPGYGWILTRALRDEKIPKKDIPAYTARQLRRVVGSGFVEIWGPIDEPPDDIKIAYDHYKQLMANHTDGDMGRGRNLFDRVCGVCHKMHGQGGEVGPDITGSNRTDIDYLLSNILEPSSEIQDDYRMVVITTRDGRTYAGNIVGETDRLVKLRIVGQEDVSLYKAEIQSQEVTPVSLMPAGLLKTLTDREVVDLLTFLMKSSEI